MVIFFVPCQVLLQLCGIVDILQALPVVRMHSQHLEAAINAFFESCETANWQSKFHSKFHWLTHMPKEMEVMGGFLPSCFTQERKHKSTKRYATAMQNLRSYDRTILEEIVAQDIYQMKEHIYCTEARLSKKCECNKRVLSFLQSVFGETLGQCYCCCSAFLSPAGSCNRGDFVLLHDEANLQAAEVISHFEVDGSLWSLVQLLTLQGYNPQTCAAKWSTAGQVLFYPTRHIKCATTWSHAKGQTIVTLVPLSFRP